MSDDADQKGRSLYYHRYTPQIMGSGGGRSTYGAPAYGSASYGSAYGAPYGSAYAAPSGGGGEEEGGTGALSLGRIIRVCSGHWMTIFVFLILGLLAAFVIFQLIPYTWKAEAYYEMLVRSQTFIPGQVYADEGMGAGGATSLQEVFNTRRELFKNTAVYKSVIDLYRTEHTASAVPTETLLDILKEDTTMTLVPGSRLVKVSVLARDPTLAADLANAYVATCKTYMGEQNKMISETAVAYLTATLDNEEHILAQLDNDLLELRKSRKIDSLNRERENTQSRLSSLDSRAIALETQISTAKELLIALSAIKEDPTLFGTLPESIPRASEIATTFQRWQETAVAKKTLLTRLTENHPDVKLKTREEEVYRDQFVETAQRAYTTAKAQLDFLERQRQPVVEEASGLRARLVSLDTDIISAQMAIQQLERTREIEVQKATDLRTRVRVAELKADENAATIKPVRAALVPEKPDSPNPYIIFGAGILLGTFIGVVFVLLLDHMEDKLVGVTDIEQRLRLKALAVFPHLRRKQRQQVALTTHADPFSQYAESMAGLRNLLDSPTYHDLTTVILCMSTQPAEGKTCTSTNLAIAYAQAGQRTLLVDFDMRRPRLAGIFGRDVHSFPSLPHILARNDASLFDSLPQETEVPNLSVVFSRASNSISPSVLMGTNIITEFFAWARKHYDHIIIDSPPFGLVGDVIVLANLVDSVLLVATPDKTRFGPIQFAARRLTEVGARLLGVVVNNVDFGRWAGFSKYETRYGYATSTYVPRTKGSDSSEELKKAVFTINTSGANPAAAANPDDRPIDESLTSDDD
ncbi:MAG: polysaccharide biosynthesis tyrosine autokinase [Candidatus Spyradenecus sp.]